MTKLTKLQKELLCILSEDGLSVSEECYKKVEELVEVMKEEKYEVQCDSCKHYTLKEEDVVVGEHTIDGCVKKNEVVLGITIYDDYER